MYARARRRVRRYRIPRSCRTFDVDAEHRLAFIDCRRQGAWRKIRSGDSVLNKAAALDLVHEHLDDTPRAAHSRFVAYVMRGLASVFAADADLWEITGLCHDLDFFVTSGDWSQHGLLTIRWLAGRLPDDALQAIAAHDHRTGMRSDTLIADMLNLADAVAIIDKRFGRDLFRQVDNVDAYATLRNHLGDRAYLADILDRRASKHRLSFGCIGDIVTAGPPQ
jgi:predicted hydrolase (HD superfamily)